MFVREHWLPKREGTHEVGRTPVQTYLPLVIIPASECRQFSSGTVSLRSTSPEFISIGAYKL